MKSDKLRIVPLLLMLTVGLLMPLSTGGTTPASTPAPSLAKGEVLEDLRYQVDVWFLRDALRARVVLKRLGPRRYLAQARGRARGLLGVLSGHWRGMFSTEMTLVEGRFRPLLYREQCEHRNKRNLSEYRFDYANRKVELYKWDNDKKLLTKRWETELEEPMYDVLSFFYNQRLQGLSPIQAGQTLRFRGIPYPQPEEIILRIGPETPQGRKVMLTLRNPVFKEERSQVFVLVNRDGVPVTAWSHMLRLGRITGKLVPGGRRLKNGQLQALVSSTSPRKDINRSKKGIHFVTLSRRRRV
ncbi:MAG: DUF3108 domain-containing protein [Deltaproteobacteria bacterium]|nr:DUF3108 domain-containing protein [Deltaproteobacteria bacterium]